MNAFLRSVGGGFAGLLRFGGRDGRLRFWPYAAFVFFLSQLAGMAITFAALHPLIVEMLSGIARTELESGPGGDPAARLGEVPDFMPVLRDVAGFNLVIAAATILLLAAAVARRLHDRDLSAYWGLLPLPFLAAALVLLPRLVAGIGAAGAPDPALFAGLMINNLLYLCALGWLIYLLVAPGTPGANRFGPPPSE